MIRIFDHFAKRYFSAFIRYYQKLYRLPPEVTEKKIKRRLGLSYINQQAKFSEELGLGRAPKSALLFLGMLFKIALSSRGRFQRKEFRLIVRDIHTDDEIERIMPLLEYFGFSNVLLVVQAKLNKEYPFTIFYQKRFCDYDRGLVLKTLFREVFLGLPLYAILSIRFHVNMYHFAIRIINEYLEYNSLFLQYKSDFLFTERCIKISPLQRYFYHKHGGKITSTVQKSLLAADQTSFYYDIDCFFTLGRASAARALQYGGKIGDIIATGSIFSHQRLPRDYSHRLADQSDFHYDLLLIGMNVMNGYKRFDTHDSFMDEYYGSIGWLGRLKREFPEMNIAIKHHSSASYDRYEDEIFKDSDVVFLDRKQNTYDIALQSRIAVTFGSTMGYELLALGKPCLFLDPDCGNIFIDGCGTRPEIDEMRCQSYDEFKGRVMDFLGSTGGRFRQNRVEKDVSAICMTSDGVFETMQNYFEVQS
jgi:hypothetical protein